MSALGACTLEALQKGLVSTLGDSSTLVFLLFFERDNMMTATSKSPHAFSPSTSWRLELRLWSLSSFVIFLLLLLPATAYSDEVIEWRESYSLTVPTGWYVDAKEYRGAADSKVISMQSPEKTVVVVAFVDGERIAEGLAMNNLPDLTKSYVEAFTASFDWSLSGRKPWACPLTAPPSGELFGQELLIDTELGQKTLHICGARQADQLIFATMWSETAAKDSPYLLEIRQIVAKIMFSPN